MAFQLAVGGVLPDDAQIVQTVRVQLEQIQMCLRKGPQPTELQMLVSPSYSAPEWLPLIKDIGVPAFGFCKSGDSDWSGSIANSVWMDTPLRSVVGETMSGRADLVLLVWNEDVTEFAGAPWELMQLAHKGKTPCLWISSKTGKSYWSRDSFFSRCDLEDLVQLCADYRTGVPEPLADTDKRIPLLALGVALRRRFLNKYRALQPETPPESDLMIRGDFSLEDESAGSEAVRRRILDYFNRFDQSAVALNSQYQAIIYWRAILPFVATVFLAVGFYAETILSVTGLPQGVRTIIAGTGFLIHGLLNLYVFFLSRYGAVRDKHRAFLQNRYMAEVLRVLIHFIPYGIYVDLRGMCNNSEKGRAAVQNMILGAEPEEQHVDGNSAFLALTHIREMLRDQSSYHAASADRFQRILVRLEKWSRYVFGAGFVMVILRAFLQFYLGFSPLTGTVPGTSTLWNSYVSSSANMIALMLPAWASYFTTKTTLCNFRFNSENHTRMAERLEKLRVHVDTLLDMGENVPVDILSSISEDLAQALIVEDTLTWERKFQDAAVTHL